VATASTFGYAGFLLGPPVIGFLASAASLRAALTTVSLLAVVAIALARFAAPGRGERKVALPSGPGSEAWEAN
jgi:MFS family permease